MEKDPLVEEMRIRLRTGGFRGGGGPVEVGRRQGLPGGERTCRARGWKNCSGRASSPRGPVVSLSARERPPPADLHRAASAPDSAGSWPDSNHLGEGILLLRLLFAMDAGNYLYF